MVMAANLQGRGGEGVKKNLLFIDDDPLVIASLKLLFRRDYNTFNSGNGENGISLFKKHRPDAVLLDLCLPGKDGMEILRTIREQDQVTPVVMMTGYGTLATAQESLRLGAVDYVHKPFDVLYLKNRIAELTAFNPSKAQALSEKLPFASSIQRLNELELSENASSAFLHDVANPLTGLITVSEWLGEGARINQFPSNEEMREALESICDNARYIAALVEHWRAFSELQTLSCEIISVEKVLALALGLTQKLALDRNVGLEIKQPVLSASLTINRYALARVLANLIQNAIEAVESHTGRVELSTEQAGSNVEIKVRDNGHGVAPDFLAKVFEPRMTTKSKNTGLGLYISKRIVQASGGDLTIRNLPQGGAEFTVSLKASPI